MKFKDLILLLLLNFFSLPKKKTFILYIINTSNILVGIYLTPFWSVGVALGLHLGGTFLSTTCVVLCCVCGGSVQPLIPMDLHGNPHNSGMKKRKPEQVPLSTNSP